MKIWIIVFLLHWALYNYKGTEMPYTEPNIATVAYDKLEKDAFHMCYHYRPFACPCLNNFI